MGDLSSIVVKSSIPGKLPSEVILDCIANYKLMAVVDKAEKRAKTLRLHKSWKLCNKHAWDIGIRAKRGNL
jgi:hypothetical protein